MITALAPLGKTYRIQILPDFTEGQATVTVLLTPKDKDKEEDVIPLQFSGTLAEVEQAITEQLPTAVTKLVEHGNSMADLDTRLAAEKKEKEEKDKPKPPKEEKPAAAAPTKPAKGKRGGKTLADVATPPAETPAPVGLTPAPTAAAAEPAAEDVDFGALFPDDPAAEPAVATEETK
jgi:hypothetical protein